MRLVNTETFQLGEFASIDSAPPFAALSHTWGEQECSFSDMQDPKVTLRAGYAKIVYCCEQAKKDGLQWAWIDTCCIDKSSSAELSEAINSMFDWYAQSAVCYVYLSDVSLPKGSPNLLTAKDLGRSRWASRGWTLQELIAPDHVRFFSDDWTECGNRRELAAVIHQVTNVAPEILERLPGSDGLASLYSLNISTRMSWAAERQTTRPEDRAYCLLGIFRVNMAMLYGEGGPRAFYRLQEEIMKRSTDQSILAWTPTKQDAFATTSVLADSPSAFFEGSRILSIPGPGTFDMTNHGLRIGPRLFRINSRTQIALLNCIYADDPTGQLGIKIVRTEDDSGLSTSYSRTQQSPVLVPLEQLKTAESSWSIHNINTKLHKRACGPSPFFRKSPAENRDVDLVITSLGASIERSLEQVKKYLRHVEMESAKDIYIAHITNRIPQVKDGNIYCSFGLKTADRLSIICPALCSTVIECGRIYSILDRPATEQIIDVYIAKTDLEDEPDSSLCRIALSIKQNYSSKLIVAFLACKCGEAESIDTSALNCRGCGITLGVANVGETISSRLYNTINFDVVIDPAPDPTPSPPLVSKQKWKLLGKLRRWRRAAIESL